MEKGFVYRTANVDGVIVWCSLFVSFDFCNLGLEIDYTEVQYRKIIHS